MPEPADRPDPAAVRQRLQARLDELRAEIASGSADERQLAGVPQDGVVDAEEQASRRALAIVEEGEVARDLDELRQVELALGRLDEGVWGLCIDCGEPIDPGRLAALPGALRCTACQQLLEQAPSSPR